MTAAEAFFAVVYFIVRAGTVASVLYLGGGAGTVVPGVLGSDIALAASIWKTGACFLVAVAWIHSVWVVVTDVGMLGLIYHDVGSGTVASGFLGCDIALGVLICRTGLWFLVVVAWSNSVQVVVMDVGMLGLMLVRVR